jgi:hypothetical protein
MALGNPKTFSKGIVTDPHPNMQPDGSYRDATNIRIINKSGNTFTVENINGNQLVETIPCAPKVLRYSLDATAAPGSGGNSDGFQIGEDYTTTLTLDGSNATFNFTFTTLTNFYSDLQTALETLGGNTYVVSAGPGGVSIYNASIPNNDVVISFNAVTFNSGSNTQYASSTDWLPSATQSKASCNLTVVGHFSFNDTLYIYTTDRIDPDYGHIWKVTAQNDGTNIATAFTYGEKLQFNVNNRIEARGIVENNCITRLVWTDNKNKLRTISIADTNVLSATIDSLSATPEFELSQPILKSITSGSLEAGMYEYTYRLKDTSGGAGTNFSHFSNLIPLSEGDMTFENVGSISTANTGKGIQIKINNIDEQFDTIEVFAVQYLTLDGGAIVKKIVETQISGTEMFFLHSDNNQPEELLDAVTIKSNSWQFCKTIEVKDNILFAGNLRNILEEITQDFSIKRFDTDATTSNNTGTGLVTNDSSFSNSTHRFWKNKIPRDNDNTEYQRILGGHTDNFDTGSNGIRFSFGMMSHSVRNYYITREAYGDTPGVAYAGSQNFSVNSNVWNQDEYVDNSPNHQEFTYPINGKPNHYNPYYASKFRGYQRGETYRFGICFYDKLGVPGFTKWIGDIEMPSHHDEYWRVDTNKMNSNTNNPAECAIDIACPDFRLSHVPANVTPAGVHHYKEHYNNLTGAGKYSSFNLDDKKMYLNDLFIRFEVRLDPAVQDIIGGYSIVRAKRTDTDKSIKAQGLLSPTCIHAKGEGTPDNDYKGSFFDNFVTVGNGESFPELTYGSYLGGFVAPWNGGTPVNNNAMFSGIIFSQSYNNDGFNNAGNFWSGSSFNLGTPGTSPYLTGQRFPLFIRENGPHGDFNNQSGYQGEGMGFYNLNELGGYSTNTNQFGWPAFSKAQYPYVFTFDSPELQSGLKEYSNQSGDQIDIISILRLEGDYTSGGVATQKKRTFQTNIDEYVAAGGNNAAGASVVSVFGSCKADLGTNSHGMLLNNNSHFSEKPHRWYHSDANWDVPSAISNHAGQNLSGAIFHRGVYFASYVVQDTGVYKGLGYKNWSGNTFQPNVTSTINIDDASSLNAGEVRSSGLGTPGGYSNMSLSVGIFSAWFRELEDVNQYSSGGFGNLPNFEVFGGSFTEDNDYYQYVVPYAFHNNGNVGSQSSNPPTWFEGTLNGCSSMMKCSPTTFLKLSEKLFGCNLDEQFYANRNETTTSGSHTFFDLRTSSPAGKVHWQTLRNTPYRLLVNIKRPVVNQYGGNTTSAINATRYITTGHFTPVSATSNYSAQEVTGGDTFVVMNVFTKDKGWYTNLVDDPKDGNYSDADSGGPDEPHMSNGGGYFSRVIAHPVETYVNTFYREDENHLNSADYLGNWGNSSALNAELWDYMYNSVYSQESDTIGFLSDSTVTDCKPTNFTNQISWSNTKLSGDVYNAWSTFPPANFHEVDGNLGAINNLFILKDEMYFLQEKGIGNLLVNPRTMITDSSGGQIFTGTGETVQDHRYFSTEFGTSHQFSLVVSGTHAYWVDALRTKFLKFNGSQLDSIGDSTGARDLLEKVIGGYDYITSAPGVVVNNVSGIRNTNQLKSFDRPIVGIGIHGVFDYDNNQVLMTVMDKYENFKQGQWSDKYYKQTLAYNEITGFITSRYSHTPNYWLSFKNRVYEFTNWNQLLPTGANSYNYTSISKDMYQWDYRFGDKCTFLQTQAAFNLTVVYSDNITTKVFDNMHIYYESDVNGTQTSGNPNPYIFESITLTGNTNNTDQLVSGSDTRFSYRDGILKFPARALNSTNRIRGQYITMKILEEANSTKKFNIFAYNSKYRVSKR